MSISVFYDEINKKETSLRLKWYGKNIKKVLEAAEEKGAKKLKPAFKLTDQLTTVLNDRVPAPEEVEMRRLVPLDHCEFMKPVDGRVSRIIYETPNKLATSTYLRARNKMAPEDKYYFRGCTSWDYGWQHGESRLPARDCNRGRVQIIKQSFYRVNGIGPDPAHYGEPAGGANSVCDKTA